MKEEKGGETQKERKIKDQQIKPTKKDSKEEAVGTCTEGWPKSCLVHHDLPAHCEKPTVKDCISKQ